MKPTHAGGVVIARRRGTAAVLLARASKPPYDWVLPKGHIEQGESPEDAARREVLEETGVNADVIKPLGDVAFEYKRRDVRVRYFLMRFRTLGAAEESRELKWCSPAQAERLLTFDNIRDMVRRAADEISTRRVFEFLIPNS